MSEPEEGDATAFLANSPQPALEHTIAGDDDNAGFEVHQPEQEEGESEPARKRPKKSGLDIPAVLGGYEIIELLGEGGMGSVYLARQVSLDRPVALKVMNARWASDPVFVARFTREAYAAAQLVHHNIVQIHDIGFDQQIHFFSMEYVKGQTLNELVKRQGKLDVDEAAGYILQAARGLKLAHDAGMVHRDIKPDNLMLNELGVVKVADLGLVKTPGVVEPDQPLAETAAPAPGKRKGSMGSLNSLPSMTSAGLAMGTPSYMAPEQAKNAASVDHRADIYSLGCTFYVLLAGRAPFKGQTAMELLLQHLNDPPPPLERYAKRVPKDISILVQRMMAKDPDERPVDLGEVIGELERFLGVSQVGPFSPTEEHADLLEQSVTKFYQAPAARLRSKVLPAFHGGCALAALLLAFVSMRLAVSILGLALMTALFTFLIRGLTSKTSLFLKVREFILGSGWSDWLTWGVALLLFLVLLHMAGILAYWFAFLVLAGSAAGVIRVLIDRPLDVQRKSAIEQVEKLLKTLRLRGLPEEAVQQFVCKYSGQHWEEFFESLFGYESLLRARAQWSRPEGGKPRPTYAAWRDPIIQWIDARQRARRESRERKVLQQVEQNKLQAEGVAVAQAQEQAAQVAAVMVSAAAEIKQQTAPEVGVATEALPAPISAKELIEVAEKPRQLTAEERQKLNASPEKAAWSLFGPRVRFLAGCLLVGLCYLWMSQGGLIPGEEGVSFQEYRERVKLADEQGHLRFLPAPLDSILSGFPVGLAGLLLVLSALTRSKGMLFFLLVAVLILLAGPAVLSTAGVEDLLGTGPRYLALIAGLLIAEFGFVLVRSAARPKL